MKRALLSPLALSLVLAAGCGGGGSNGAASSTSVPAATDSSDASSAPTEGGAQAAFPEDNCGMIPEADLSEAAGFALEVTTEDPLGVPGCQYTAANGGIVYLTYSADDFEYQLALGMITTPKMLTGLGKEAFEGSPANFRSVEVLLEDGRALQVQGGAGADDRDALKRIAALMVTTL